MDELKPIIRSLAISSAGGLTLQQLERDFKSLEGYSIPYQRLGFTSLASLLQTLTDVVRLNGKDQQSIIHPVTTEKNKHIRALVEKSKKSKKKPTALRELLPQKPKISCLPQKPKSVCINSSKPCNNVAKYTTKQKEKHSSYGHSSRGSGAVPTTASSSSPSFDNYNASDYHFGLFMRWLHGVLPQNVNNGSGQSKSNRKRISAQATVNQICDQYRLHQNPPSVRRSGQKYNAAGCINIFSGWNYKPAGLNNNFAGWNNGISSNNNYSGWNNNSAGWNNNSSEWNNNYSGWNNNYSGWNNNSAGWNNNSAGRNKSCSGRNKSSSGWNNNSAEWNNNSSGCNFNSISQRQGNTNNFANNGNNYCNRNYPINSNYGAYYNGCSCPGAAAGYQNPYGYPMNHPTNYGYNNYSSYGFNNSGQNNYNMPDMWNSYGQFFP